MSSKLVLYELAASDPAVRFSPHCWKTRMALAHKGLEAEGVPWRFTEKEEIAFSGQKAVPVLVDDGQTLSDSWRIAIHLEEKYSKRPSLFGSDAAMPLAHFVNQWADAVLLPAAVRIILTDVYACLHEKDQSYFRSSREKGLGVPLESAVADRSSRIAQFREALQPLRRLLKGQSFISGASPAYADYCVFGYFMWARCTSETAILEESDPVYVWRDRLLDEFDGMARSAPTIQRSTGTAR